MGSRRVRIVAAVGVVLIVVATFASGRAWYWVLCRTVPMSFAEVDLNHNGRVSFDEADYVCSCGSRQVTLEGKQCTEYFAYKDGLPLKTVCPSN
jgi:hypothetical protein